MPPTLWPVSNRDCLPRHFWRRAFGAVLQALALFALLIAILAPFFDHHYVQRDPHHAHIFLGVVDASALLEHHHVPPTKPDGQSGGETVLLNATGVFSVPSAGDWAIQGLRAPLLFMMALPLALFAVTMGRYERLRHGQLIFCEPPTLSPPEKPPRY